MNNPPIISEVTFLPLRISPKGLIGISSLLFDNRISLNSISVYSTPDGDIRLLFPISALRNGKQINTYYPVDKGTYESMRLAVARKIEEVHQKVIEKNIQSNGENYV